MHYRFGRVLAAAVNFCVMTGLLGGCIASPDGPSRPQGLSAQVQAIDQLNGATKLVEEFYGKDAITDPAKRTARRNEIVRNFVAVLDANYFIYERALFHDKRNLDFVTEVVTLGLGLATGATGGATAKSVLGFVTAGVAGGKASIDKNFYFDKTVQALTAAMRARRSTVRLVIERGLTAPESTYGFSTAMADLEQYYSAGTLLGALETIQQQSAVKEESNQQKIDEIKITGTFAVTVSANEISAWLAAGDPQARRAKLAEWLLRQPSPDNSVRIPDLLYQSEREELRTRAIRDVVRAPQ